MVCNFFGTRDWFCGRQFFHGLVLGGRGDSFRMIETHCMYCALYFYCYYISHLRSPRIRSRKWGTLVLRNTCECIWDYRLLLTHQFTLSLISSLSLWIVFMNQGTSITPKLGSPLFGGCWVKRHNQAMIRRRKDLLFAASKKNSRDISQSNISLNSKIW